MLLLRYHLPSEARLLQAPAAPGVPGDAGD